MTDNAGRQVDGGAGTEAGSLYPWYVVIILTSVYMLSFVDRTILGMRVSLRLANALLGFVSLAQ